MKGVVIGEKHPMEDPSCLPDKKGKAFDRPKGKEVASVPEPKRKVTRARPVWASIMGSPP